MQCNAVIQRHRSNTAQNAKLLVLIMSLENSGARCGYWQVPKRIAESVTRHNFRRDRFPKSHKPRAIIFATSVVLAGATELRAFVVVSSALG
jgi:hypothetical protein